MRLIQTATALSCISVGILAIAFAFMFGWFWLMPAGALIFVGTIVLRDVILTSGMVEE